MRNFLASSIAISVLSFGLPVFAENCPAGSDLLACNDWQGSVNSDGSSSGENGVVIDDTTGGDGLSTNSFLLFDLEGLDSSLVADTLVLTLFDVTYTSFIVDEGGFVDPAPFTVEVYDMSDIDNDDFALLKSGDSFGTGSLADADGTRTDIFTDLQTPDAGGPAPYGSAVITPTASTGGFLDFEIVLDNGASEALKAAIDDELVNTFGLGLSLVSSGEGTFSFESASAGTSIPAGGINSVPEVSATGALAAFGSLLALMAFLWERRRIGIATA